LRRSDVAGAGEGRAHHDGRAVSAGVGDQGPGAPYNAAAKFYKVYSESTEAVGRTKSSQALVFLAPA